MNAEDITKLSLDELENLRDLIKKELDYRRWKLKNDEAD